MVDFVILNGLAIEGAAQSSTGSSRDRRTTIMETMSARRRGIILRIGCQHKAPRG
jgi:hypothetical protein